MPRIEPVSGLVLPLPRGADELTHLLYVQDDVLSRRQALCLMSSKSIRHRVESGRWRAVHAGVYVAHTGPITREQRRWIAVLAAGGGRPAVLGGLSALEMLGLRGRNVDGLHVLISTARRDRDPPPGVIVHRTGTLSARDIHRAGRPPCTMPARALIDAVGWASTDDRARAVVAAAFQQRLLGRTEIDEALSRLRRVRRRKLIVATATDAQDGSHSLPELEFVRLCRSHGLPVPQRQAARSDARGGRRYLDALFEEWHVQVEIDGSQHLEAGHWWADMRRQNDLWVAGLRILRYPAWTIRERPDEVAAQLRAALISAGWQPPTKALTTPSRTQRPAPAPRLTSRRS